MSENVYSFIIDCSLDKKGNILIYEIQPLVFSGLGRNTSKIGPAFDKGFPNFHIKLDYRKLGIGSYESKTKTGKKKILITDRSYYRSSKVKNVYDYVDNSSLWLVHQLSNKVYQRLYLPSEVSPEYTLFDLSLNIDTEIKRVLEYFREKNIDKIVLKHPDTTMGKGNVFIDSIQNENTIRQGIEKLSVMECVNTRVYPAYILVENQKTLPRVSRKTGEKKSSFTTYRIVGIAEKNGMLGYFIATKSISKTIDSHKRTTLKAYFDGGKKTPASCIEHFGLKEKYYKIGENSIEINPESLDKISKAVHQLSEDLSNKQNFKAHVDSLILTKKEKERHEKAQLISESFLSALKIIDSDNVVKVETQIKTEKSLALCLSTLQPRLPSEVCLFLKKIASQCANSNIYSPRSNFFSAFQRIEININTNSKIFMNIAEETINPRAGKQKNSM